MPWAVLRWLVGVVFGCVVVTSLLGGSAFAQVDSPPDPGVPGPYAVGATRRSFTRTSSTTGEPRVLEAVIWYPAAAGSVGPNDPSLAAPLDLEPAREQGPYPAIVFSHSSGGQPWGVTYLTTHLASHGFVVIAPSHPGNTTTDCPRPCTFVDPTSLAAIEDSIADRPADLAFALDRVLGATPSDDPLFTKLLDRERVGVSGYSLGGGVVLGALADDHRYRAAVVLAPTVGTRSLVAASNATRPVMLIAGKLDDYVRFDDTQRLYDAFPSTGSEHWLVALPRAGHFNVADRCPSPQQVGCGPNDLPLDRAHALVRRWATAFVLRHVGLDDRYAASLDPSVAAGNLDVEITMKPEP